MLDKSCVLCCVSHNDDGDDHGVRQADTARAHARWRYLPYRPQNIIFHVSAKSKHESTLK